MRWGRVGGRQVRWWFRLETAAGVVEKNPGSKTHVDVGSLPGARQGAVDHQHVKGPGVAARITSRQLT